MSSNVSTTNVVPNSDNFFKFVFGVIGIGFLLSWFVPLYIQRKFDVFTVGNIIVCHQFMMTFYFY